MTDNDSNDNGRVGSPVELARTRGWPAPRNVGPFALGADVWPGLGKLVEELGEAVGAAGKLFRMGGIPDRGEAEAVSALWHEMADAYAALDAIIELNPVLGAVRERIEERRQEKFKRYVGRHWLRRKQARKREKELLRRNPTVSF